MKYGKLIDNNFSILKQPIHTENGDLFTNDKAVLLDYGYKPIIYTDPPEAPEGFYPEPKWTEMETEIVHEWELVPLPLEKATPEDYKEAF